MTSSFDWSKYENPQESNNEFDWSKYEKPQKKQEPVTLKGSAKAFGSGYAGGAGGLPSDISQLTKVLTPVKSAIEMLSGKENSPNFKGTQELTESLNPEGDKNALERILQHSGQFSGQEGAIGLAAGGPAGGAVGSAHGAVSGALYGAAKELGANDTVALVAALATLSPIAAERLIQKLSISKKSKEALTTAVKTEAKPPPSEPPPPPSPPTEVAGIGPGTVLPKTESGFANKEQIIEKLAQEGKPAGTGLQVPLGQTKGEAPGLQGRVSEAQEVGSIISKEPFASEAQAGRDISREVKTMRDAEKDIVREKYNEAEKVTQNHEDIYPELASENERRIARLEELEKRSAAEEAVYQDALALRRMVGTPDQLVQANAKRLMKQANSFSSKINYELPYAGAKAAIKDMVHQMNNAVISSLDRAGLDSGLVREADKTFARFANRFMGDEISPFLQKKILNPEQLSLKAISEPASHRAVKEAIGSRKSDIVNKIDRELVHQSMDRYYKDPGKVGTKEYVRDLKNLAERIGKEKIAEVDHFLRQKQLNFERKAFAENKLREAQLSRQKLAGKPAPQKISEKISHEAIANKPEDIDKLFKSRSDIRKLKRAMKDKGLEKEFEKLAEDRVKEIFKEGKYGEKQLTGEDITRIIDKEHEILEELLGKEQLSELYKIGTLAEEKEISRELLTHILKKTGRMALTSLGLGKLIKILPI